jgi:hypothetical protein
MITFKLFCINFILFVYENYVKEDFDVLTKFGKIIIYPAWLALAISIWLICPIFIPEYFFKQSKIYAEIQKQIKTIKMPTL